MKYTAEGITLKKSFCFILWNVLLLSGCFNLSDQQGVDNLWRVESNLSDIEKGKTSQEEIIKLFGPPSQIINLDEGSVFYYLLQRKEGRGVFLLLYNFRDEEIIFDRAIFFFNDQGVLTEYGLSIEQIERKNE